MGSLMDRLHKRFSFPAVLSWVGLILILTVCVNFSFAASPKKQDKKQAEAHTEKLVDGLPVDIAKDRYLLTARDYCKWEKIDSENPCANLDPDLLSTTVESAISYYERLMALKVSVPDDVYYEYGRSLLANSKFGSKKFLVEYLKRTGQTGKYYEKALLALSTAEEREGRVMEKVDSCTKRAVSACQALRNCAGADCKSQELQLWRTMSGSDDSCNTILSEAGALRGDQMTQLFAPYTLYLSSGTYICSTKVQIDAREKKRQASELETACSRGNQKFSGCEKTFTAPVVPAEPVKKVEPDKRYQVR